MRYRLECTSKWKVKDIIKKYPVINNYNPVIDYPYSNPNAARLVIEVDDLIRFYDDVKQEVVITIDDIADEDMYCLRIHDGYDWFYRWGE